MIPTSFDYHRAESVEAALKMLQEQGGNAKLLAGGHSLLPAMKLRLSSPGALIDISRIAELRYIREEKGHLAIGAATTHFQLESSSVVRKRLPLIADTAAKIGDVQVRNMGTIGGSLAHADPAADYPAALLAAEAQIMVRSARGKRSIPAADFFQGLFMTALKEDELITEVCFPLPEKHTGGCYLKFAQPASRFAIVGCAALVTVEKNKCRQVRVAFTGVADRAFRDAAVEAALQGQPADDAHIAAAAEKAAAGVSVLGDHFASEDYRRHLAKVYAKRALSAAVKATH